MNGGRRSLAPVPVVGGKSDEDEALGVGGDVVEAKRALAFPCPHLAEREEAGEAAVGGAIGRIGEEARCVLEVEAGTDDETEPDVPRRHVGAHNAGQRVAVGHGDGLEAE